MLIQHYIILHAVLNYITFSITIRTTLVAIRVEKNVQIFGESLLVNPVESFQEFRNKKFCSTSGDIHGPKLHSRALRLYAFIRLYREFILMDIYIYSDIRKLARKVCLSMDVFCYPPYLFRSRKIEISRSRKSLSENMPPQ